MDSGEYIQLWGYLVLYAIFSTSLFPSSLWLATLTSCLVVKSVYFLSDALGDDDIPDIYRFGIRGEIILMLWTMMFGRLIDALRFAILAELLLCQLHYKILNKAPFQIMWVASFYYPLTTIVGGMVMLQSQQVASAAKFVGFSTVFSKSASDGDTVDLGK
jgi:hypothetical protein